MMSSTNSVRENVAYCSVVCIEQKKTSKQKEIKKWGEGLHLMSTGHYIFTEFKKIILFLSFFLLAILYMSGQI